MLRLSFDSRSDLKPLIQNAVRLEANHGNPETVEASPIEEGIACKKDFAIILNVQLVSNVEAGENLGAYIA